MSRTYIFKGLISAQTEFAVDPLFYNYTAVVKYYSDAYITEVTPATGSVTISGTIIGGAIPISFFDSPIDSTVLSSFASAGSPLESITIIPVGITGATYYQVSITGTEG